MKLIVKLFILKLVLFRTNLKQGKLVRSRKRGFQAFMADLTNVEASDSKRSCKEQVNVKLYGCTTEKLTPRGDAIICLQGRLQTISKSKSGNSTK